MFSPGDAQKQAIAQEAMPQKNKAPGVIREIIENVERWLTELCRSNVSHPEALKLMLSIFKDNPEKLFLLAQNNDPAKKAFSELTPEQKIHFFVKIFLKLKQEMFLQKDN